VYADKLLQHLQDDSTAWTLHDMFISINLQVNAAYQSQDPWEHSCLRCVISLREEL